MESTGYLYGSWTREFDTSRIDPGMVVTTTTKKRFVFHDAYRIIDGSDMRGFLREKFHLAAIAAMDIPRYQRRTFDIETLAFRNGWRKMPLWLAISIASALDQSELPSRFAVLMHEPVHVLRRDRVSSSPRMLALAEGDRELLVTAPRADAPDVWEENRTFVFLSQ